MCGGGGGGSPQPTPQAIQPRNPDLVRVSQRPERKELLDEDEVRTGVEYGKKADPLVAAKATGTDALKINLNTGNTGGSGGVNV
jgi:hypothetical protein